MNLAISSPVMHTYALSREFENSTNKEFFFLSYGLSLGHCK